MRQEFFLPGADTGEMNDDYPPIDLRGYVPASPCMARYCPELADWDVAVQEAAKSDDLRFEAV